MFEKIRSWYLRNYVEITWFLIGWLTFGGVIDFARGDYLNAVLLWSIAFVNYIFSRR